MIPAYLVLIFLAFIGRIVAAHLRVRQEQKFSIFKIYEEELGLYDFKKGIIEKSKSESRMPYKIFTTRLIELSHWGIIVIAFFLLLKRIIFT